MGKEKRKTRLEKGTTGEFIGFGAFAAPASAPIDASASSTASGAASGTATTTSNSTTSMALSPIYSGSDSQLSLMFQRIGQKRDAITKTKALQELAAYFANSELPNNKKHKVEALSHLGYLYHTKLHYESAASVRSTSLSCLQAASLQVPKAWTNITSTQPELWGMIVCAQADPDAQVRVAATSAFTQLMKENADAQPQFQQGVWMFVQRMLCYGKPLAMHEAMFAKKNESKLSEHQMEELQEKFERIVGTALYGLQLWIPHQTITTTTTTTNSSSPEDVRYLWKTMTSPQTALRRKTYALLSTCCQQAPLLVDGQDPMKVGKLLAQSLNSEKEASNLTTLVETVLSYLAHFPTELRSDVMVTLYVKPLGKLVKRGCYGASASSWALTVLPFLAMMSPTTQNNNNNNNMQLQASLLSNVWEGRTHVIGVADTLEVVAAVAESAAFLVGKKDSHPPAAAAEPTDDETTSTSTTITTMTQSIATCWLDALELYLSTTATGMASRTHQRLGKNMARQLLQLEHACDQQTNNSGIYTIQDWFWRQELPKRLLNEETTILDQQLVHWLKEIDTEEKRLERLPSDSVDPAVVTTDSSSRHGRLAPILADIFHVLLTKVQGALGLIPTSDTYDLWIAILKYAGAPEIFTPTADTSLETFLMNELLRWMVIHTSALSEQGSDELTTQQDFTLLQLCLPSVSNSSIMWESILRELVAAHCDLGRLVTGLVILVGNDDDEEGGGGGGGGTAVDRVRCQTLDNFCMQIAQETTEHLHQESHHHDDESSGATELLHEMNRKAADFLEACCGLGDIETSLVGEQVFEAWIECACPLEEDTNRNDAAGPNPVLETLVFLLRQNNKQETWSEEKFHRILLESWRQGGDLWMDTSTQILNKHPVLRTQIVGFASKELQSHLSRAMDDSSAAAKAHVWADRAYRILMLCGLGITDDSSSSEGALLPSLRLVGLADLESQGQVFFSHLCLLFLIERIGSTDDRLEVFDNSGGDSAELIANTLIALSNASTDPLKAQSVARREDDCAELLVALGGKSLSQELVESWSYKVLDVVALSMKSSNSNTLSSRGVAVLSQLVELSFLPVLPSKSFDSSGKMQAEEVAQGAKVWYITNQEDPGVREEVTVVKVHHDIPTELYFTIRLESDGTVQERQTVVERLRKTQNKEKASETTDGVSTEKVTGKDLASRQKLVDAILTKAVRPFSDGLPLPAAEILNVVVSQCGILGGRGLGTTHYEVFRLLIALQGSLEGNFGPASEQLLWKLAFALGFGCNTPSSPSMKLLSFDPTDSVSVIVQNYSSEDLETSMGLDRATVAWLVVAVPVVESVELKDQVISLLFRLSVRLFQNSKDVGFQLNHFMALRAIRAAQLMSHEVGTGESVVQEDEAEALVEMVKAFATVWEAVESSADSDHHSQPVWLSLPLFRSIFEASMEKRSSLMATAGRRDLNNIVQSLFVESKRGFCLRLLDAFADAGVPIHEEAEDIINAESLKRLKGWCSDLTSEEGEELEDDVGVAAQWIPKRLMNEIESWSNESRQDTDEVSDCGRLLAWLALLRIVDVASTKDTMNRPALTSYISKCQSVDHILNATLNYANIGKDRKAKMPPILDNNALWEDASEVELPKVASLVVFRTVEIFPTLAKHWWEMECPKYFTQPVRDFVETQVSPEILRRELDRIKRKTSTFGDMTVTGSSISREITALYVQDDFTLTVLIRMPLSFPFRRAEVDCSKTLGVPETRWKRWALQITLMLNNQGGTLQDALMLWKENVDKEFEGIEPCPVCYSVLHVKSHKLPEMECKTCHHRFHFDCLTQWFKSSGKSACVLCQQPWSGTRVT
jgi:hypothetical protein